MTAAQARQTLTKAKERFKACLKSMHRRFFWQQELRTEMSTTVHTLHQCHVMHLLHMPQESDVSFLFDQQDT